MRGLGIFFVIVGILAGSVLATEVYEVVDVGVGPYPVDVGNNGQVLFTKFVLVPDDNGGFERVDFGGTSASEMNNHGEIIDLGCIWVPDGAGGYSREPVDLPWAYGLNDAGDVAGSKSTGRWSPFVQWADGEVVGLGTLGGLGGYAIDINDRGEVCGYAWNTEGNEHAFYWTEETGMIDVGTFGGEISRSTSINNKGEIVGAANDEEEKYVAFLWSKDDGLLSLGMLGGATYDRKSVAMDINNRSIVVGNGYDANGVEHGFVWSKQRGLRDLNDMIDGEYGVIVNRAAGLNDHGQILVKGTSSSGEKRCYLLNPVSLYAPVADAGEDMMVYSGMDGLGEVVLDGSGSYDGDGDELDYLWYIGDELIGEGVNPVVELEAGEYVIELVVFDGFDEASDEVVVEVLGAIETSVRVLPRVINLKSRGRGVLALVELPEGIVASDIDGEYGVVLGPGEIEARFWRVLGNGDKLRLIAMFDRNEVVDAVKESGGEVSVGFRLVSGEYVYGEDVVKVVGNGKERGRDLRRVRRRI